MFVYYILKIIYFRKEDARNLKKSLQIFFSHLKLWGSLLNFMKPIHLKYDEYDMIIEKIEKMNFKCEGWLPTEADIIYYSQSTKTSRKFIEFLLWILNTYTGDTTSSEFKHIKKVINNILYEYIIFED